MSRLLQLLDTEGCQQQDLGQGRRQAAEADEDDEGKAMLLLAVHEEMLVSWVNRDCRHV